jgi:hypothetical protein
MLEFTRIKGILLVLAALLAGQGLLGCVDSLCTKRLYLYRDTPEKRQAPDNMALLITNPNLVKAVMPGYTGNLEAGCQWAEAKPAHETEVYLLSIEGLDGKPVYQGLCLDVTRTYACEVRPGSRQVMVRADLFGPWGHGKKVETVNVTLEPGKTYFFRLIGEDLKEDKFALQVDSLPAAYTPELRARVVDWERNHSTGRGLAD